jgi:hypothetical protein
MGVGLMDRWEKKVTGSRDGGKGLGIRDWGGEVNCPDTAITNPNPY